jgi:plasmid segregation protein ParM
MNLAGIDIGNDSIKVVLDGVREPLMIQNIVAPGYERHILQEEDSPLKALDVVVHSPRLSKNGQRYFVGLLAMENEDSMELEETDNKAVSDQSLVVALTALAYAGIVSQSVTNSGYSNIEEVEYVIGTGLPVRSYSYYNKMFEDRLVGEHEVTFLTTPTLRNREVKVSIRRAVISIEGAAALFHMATHENLQVRDEELHQGCIGICEIGALTTDFPVVNKMSIDNQFSTGEQIGMATYLDHIIRDVEDQFGYRFPSRAKLVQRIKRNDFTIRRIGEGQSSMKQVVDMYFSRAANKIVDLIKKRWKKHPDIQCFYVIGGGAAALRSYIVDASGSIKLRFVDDSELLNVHGYLKMAKNKVNQNKFA